MLKHAKKENPTLEQLVAFNSSSYYTHYSTANFQRKYRKHFKFSLLSDCLFSITSKATKHSLKIEVQENNYFRLSSTKKGVVCDVCALSTRELVEKIIYHELI